MCYPLAGFPQLRVCCDFINYLFHLDNICDEMDDNGTHDTATEVLNALHHPYAPSRPATRVGRMTRDYWRRLIVTASPGAQQRFIETFDLFFQAVTQQAMDRKSGAIPDFESYIAMRRDTSGCKPCWALIEYANNLDLPAHVMTHPVINGLEEAANDLVTWSNDIYSYNVEQSKGDTHNLIVVIQQQYGLDLQSAVDFVGDLCLQTIDRFSMLREQMPSWSPQIDRQVQIYVDGLGDWVIGNLSNCFLASNECCGHFKRLIILILPTSC
ncbi:Alpha-muurolene synthase [Grifola frondosa]|uniref:Terpene synthase n=1 Tax=Grifola frondosa TaxID=5627 RepID=A0A1C7LRQ9_GRIFR|nr:Alpha-muurolene synthase [Grifola frondosa]